MIIIKILFYLSAFIIFWAMVGYPISLKLIKGIFSTRKNKKDYSHQPSVTLLIVAHNEEKVMLEKLQNVVELDYPKEKLEILVSSDNSTDDTNQIVNDFIINNPQHNVRLYEVKQRKGKTNAQNEAVKTLMSEYIVMTDANSLLDKNAIKELMASFISDDIAYVSGRLSIINADDNLTSQSESSYWSLDLQMRDIESNMQTITAGNGALYACRTKDYIEVELIQSHDSAMPLYYGLEGKRAIANHDAIAYEKAGEVVEDEFKRKVRMNRIILKHILPDLRLLNIFKYKWFTFFYFGHRTSRYLLWISHLVLLITNFLLVKENIFYLVLFVLQLIVYGIAIIQHFLKLKNKYLNIIYYYVMTIVAQWVGVYRIVTGNAKPFWEKAESTR